MAMNPITARTAAVSIMPHSDMVGIVASGKGGGGVSPISQQNISTWVWSPGLHDVSTIGSQGIVPPQYMLIAPVPPTTGPPGPPGPHPACFLLVHMPMSYPLDAQTNCAHALA